MIEKEMECQEMRKMVLLEEMLRGNKKIAVEVQFCRNCDSHKNVGKHSESVFLEQYEQLKRRLAQLNVIVKKKQLPEGLLRWSPYSAPNVYFHREYPEQIIYFPQIGSFEIFFQGRRIFSRLQTHKWPNFNTLFAEICKTLLQTRNHSIQIESKSQRKDLTGQNLASSRTIEFDLYEKSKRKFYRMKQRYEQQKRLRDAIDNQDIVRPGTTYTTKRSINVRKRINIRQLSERGASFNARASNTIQEDTSFLESDRNNSKIQSGASKTSSITGQRSNIRTLDISLAQQKAPDQIVYIEPIFPKTTAFMQQFQKGKHALAQRVERYKRMQTPIPSVDQSGINIHRDNNSIRSTARNEREVVQKIITEEKSTNENGIDRTIKNTLIGKEEELKNAKIEERHQPYNKQYNQGKIHKEMEQNYEADQLISRHK